MIGSLTELFDLDIMLKKNCVSFSSRISSISNSFDKMGKGILCSKRPIIEVDYNSFILELLNVVGSNKELTILGISWQKLINLILRFILVLHALF